MFLFLGESAIGLLRKLATFIPEAHNQIAKRLCAKCKIEDLEIYQSPDPELFDNNVLKAHPRLYEYLWLVCFYIEVHKSHQTQILKPHTRKKLAQGRGSLQVIQI